MTLLYELPFLRRFAQMPVDVTLDFFNDAQIYSLEPDINVQEQIVAYQLRAVAVHWDGANLVGIRLMFERLRDYFRSLPFSSAVRPESSGAGSQ